MYVCVLVPGLSVSSEDQQINSPLQQWLRHSLCRTGPMMMMMMMAVVNNSGLNECCFCLTDRSASAGVHLVDLPALNCLISILLGHGVILYGVSFYLFLSRTSQTGVELKMPLLSVS